ncbi:tRNA pseudouridine(55) synthase TruB [Caulobacter sp. S45]|jgi:tRNA pseudouridine55 synthase|uniref:tRNA pseudouridine(55) synthase TruB n=1 Tax=Caulobacter sp. S45 TaxID=1641861 RepID=UPI00131AA6F5|nr:tRNA pseudouridine(55) synthase TruB [Caulobacter sp. S45]
MGRRKKGDAVSGWICLDKPIDLGSTDAVARIRRLFNAQKAGHAGTLDPLASGILPIALGEATKTVPFLMEAGKSYRFTIQWGAATASFDREGEIIARSDVRPTVDQVEAALPAFVGEIMQVPPNFSAIKVDGQRAYDLAREGVEFELEARPITVHRLAVTEAPDADHVTLEMDCGKGSYVRAIVRDLAIALGAYGHVSALRRTRVGGFNEENATPLEKLFEMEHMNDRLEALLPVETALDDIPALALTTEDAFRLKQGRSVVLVPRQVEELRPRLVSRTVAGHDAGRTVLATFEGRAHALCEMRAGRLNPTRIFHLDLES